MNPTTYGDYPQIMKDQVGDRLPKFTEDQKQKLKMSYDFVGINYYTATFAAYNGLIDPSRPTWESDSLVKWDRKFFYQLKRIFIINLSSNIKNQSSLNMHFLNSHYFSFTFFSQEYTRIQHR